MLTRFAAPTLGPNMLAAMRMGFATLALALLMRLLGQRWPLAHWREVCAIAFVAVAGPHLMFSWGAVHLPAGYAALLYVTSVLFGAFASAWLKEEVLTSAKLAGCVIGFIGAALVVRLGPLEPDWTLVAAVLITTLGSALSGISTPFIKRAITRMDPLALTTGMHAAAFIMLAPGAFIDWPASHMDIDAIAAVALMGVASSGLAFWMYARIMQFVSPIAALGSTFMITGFGVLWAVLFLGEKVGLGHLAGGTLILLASMLATGYNPLRLIAARLGAAVR